MSIYKDMSRHDLSRLLTEFDDDLFYTKKVFERVTFFLKSYTQ